MCLWKYEITICDEINYNEKGIIYGKSPSDAVSRLENWYGIGYICSIIITPIGEDNEPYIIESTLDNSKLM